MPPKPSTLETPRKVGKPKLPPSGDPALELKRQKAREASQRLRDKKKAATAAASGTATPAVAPFDINQKKTMDAITKRMKVVAETNAKGTLTEAIKARKARKELAGLKKEALNKIVKPKLPRYIKGKGMVPITLPWNDFEKYIQSYPSIIEFIESKRNDMGIVGGYKVRLTYQPFNTYDKFALQYLEDGNEAEFDFKINNNVDAKYSNYLYDTYYKVKTNYPKGSDASSSVSSSDTLSTSTGSSLSSRSSNSSKISNSTANYDKETGLVLIDITWKDAYRLFGKNKGAVKLMKEHEVLAKGDPPEIYYRPYSSYDYFEYHYDIYKLPIKVQRMADEDYSNYLYNKYYQEIIRPMDLTDKSTMKTVSGNSSLISMSKKSGYSLISSTDIGNTKDLFERTQQSNPIAKKDTVKPNRVVQGWQGQ